MQSSRTKRWVGVGVAAVLCGCLVSAVRGQQAAPKGPTAAQAFKNIQALKEMPADQLMPAMMQYAKDLGVTCDYCHTGADYAADTNPHKKSARAMMLMTQKLNQTEPTLNKKLTCYTCHRGAALPVRSEEEAKARAAGKKPAAAPAATQGGQK